MADVVSPSTNAAETSTKKAKKNEKAIRPKASHPPTAVMVTSAIKNLQQRGGSSLQAIKKYVASTYSVDAEKLAPFIKKYIKTSVASGSLVQTKGKGASGSFKLSSGTTSKTPSSSNVTKVAKKPANKRSSKPRAKSVEKPATLKKSPAKKATKPKKAPVAEKKAVVAPKTKAAKPKWGFVWKAKPKRVAKAATKKPKSPKPKTTKPKASAAKSPRKAVSKKK